MKTVARFLARRVDVSMAKVVTEMTPIDKEETSDEQEKRDKPP